LENTAKIIFITTVYSPSVQSKNMHPQNKLNLPEYVIFGYLREVYITNNNYNILIIILIL